MPYPSLVSFLNAHPEIARNPGFYVANGSGPRFGQDHATQVLELWMEVLNGLAILAGFGMAIGLLVWLIGVRLPSGYSKVVNDVGR